MAEKAFAGSPKHRICYECLLRGTEPKATNTEVRVEHLQFGI